MEEEGEETENDETAEVSSDVSVEVGKIVDETEVFFFDADGDAHFFFLVFFSFTRELLSLPKAPQSSLFLPR